MSILESLLCHDEWLAFFEYKKSGGHLGKADEKELYEFIANKNYLQAAARINNGGLFSLPEAVKVNKSASSKKRTVFIFSEEENFIQKFLAYKLLDYDYLFSDNLYSFRRNMGVKKAVTRLVYHKGINSMYSFKLDISDYFNSVSARLLLPELESVLEDDRLFVLIKEMLLEPYALCDGKREKVKKGILAGSPLSGFLANLYISALDKYFEDNNVLYARYSDDIIFFAETEKELNFYINKVMSFLNEKGLTVNENKVEKSLPGEAWTFLGFEYCNGVIDISPVSKMKLKKKMRRKARALYRWRIKKNAEPERAVAAFIKYFDKKLYQNPVNNEITWARWYFPIVNTHKSLKELDSYMQQCVRYIATGKQNKSSYNFTYENMKALGYVTLVNSFYKSKNNK